MSAPNILFIQVDQLTASFLASYGNAIAKTPNIDLLAERSVVFDSAYTNFALCAPSRFSVLSGQLASESLTLAGPCTRNVQMDYDEEVLHRARRKLYDLARNVGVGENQPWHMTVSFTHPHDPYQCSHEYWNRYDADDNRSRIDAPRTRDSRSG